MLPALAAIRMSLSLRMGKTPSPPQDAPANVSPALICQDVMVETIFGPSRSLISWPFVLPSHSLINDS
jgi:hypothetical protein